MATPHQHESNGRPSSSSPRHFFRVILPKTVQDQKKLILPEFFVQEFGDELSSIAKLSDPNERVWQVGVEKSMKDVWFGDKWTDFVDYYSITCGHFIVFKYEGNSSFRVLIFDPSTCEISYPSHSPTSDQQPEISLLPHHGEEIATEEGVKILGSAREISHSFDAPASDRQPNHAELYSSPRHEQEIEIEEGVKILGSDCETSHPCDGPTSDKQLNHAELSLPRHEQEIGTQHVKSVGSNSEISNPRDAPTSDEQPNHVELSLLLPNHEQKIGTEEGVKNLGSDHEISDQCDAPTSDQQPNHSELSLPHHGQEIGTEEVEILGSTSPHGTQASLENINDGKPSLDMVRIWSYKSLLNEAIEEENININDERPSSDMVQTWTHEQQESLLDEAKDSSSHQSKNGENIETKHPNSGGMNIDDHQVNETGSCKSEEKIGSHSSHKVNKRTKNGKHEEDTGTSRKRRRKAKSPVVRRVVSEQEKANALHRARLFRSENPFFTKTIGKSSLQNPHVYVEKSFSKEHMKGPPGWLKLEVSDGRQWSVSYTHSNGEGSAKCLRKGWAAFLKENSLEEGDVCVFELVKPDDIVLRVEIFRVDPETVGESGALTLTLN